MAEKFLRQKLTGTIYQWTSTLAKRSDMVDYDPITAQKRIEALKAQRAAEAATGPVEPAITPEMIDQAKELTDLENELDAKAEAETQESTDIETKKRFQTDEELQQEEKDKMIDKDPHIIAIKNMKKKPQVEEFLLKEYGIELDPENMTFKEMQAEAMRLRTTRMFED